MIFAGSMSPEWFGSARDLLGSGTRKVARDQSSHEAPPGQVAETERAAARAYPRHWPEVE